jgi:sugar O-acyltransferase (sialic acid O-acetyltransferase NeuD family)
LATIGIYGCGGFGRGLLPTLRAQYGSLGNRFVFVDDATGTDINGAPTVSFDEFAAIQDPEKRVTIAVADASVRRKLAERCSSAGIDFLDVQAPNVIIGDCVQIGEGAVLCPFSHITSNVEIGVHFQLNIYSYVEHDCIIGDYVTFAPGVKCNGNIHIGSGAYIGSGAVIRQGRPGQPLLIGENAVVGMGAVVTKDVAPNTTVVGNPARQMGR